MEKAAVESKRYYARVDGARFVFKDGNVHGSALVEGPVQTLVQRLEQVVENRSAVGPDVQ